MTLDSKSLKAIEESKYLSAENAWRYRAIMRTFYLFDQKFKHWLSKEEVYNSLAKESAFKDYSLELCQQDLTALHQWKNLSAVQDTAKVTSYKQFINKQYRYQMTEYAIEIERMTLKLENITIEGGSLEPTLLERIKDEFAQLKDQLKEADDKRLDGWWRQLMSDFQRLNQNYQDYIRDWYSLKAEELMKTQGFFLYKEKLIAYLRSFIKELQRHAYQIEKDLEKVAEEDKNQLFSRLLAYEMSLPRIDIEGIDPQEMSAKIQGRYDSFQAFFCKRPGKMSEVDTILTMTNEIIRRITRYAASILELSSQYSSRKEEYRKIAQLFRETKELEAAHRLSAQVFGIGGYKHFSFEAERETESIQSSTYQEAPLFVQLRPRIRTYREKMIKTAIPDHKKDKEKMREKVLADQKKEKKLLRSYLKDDRIDFSQIKDLSPSVRRTLLRWLTRAIQEKGQLTTTEQGEKYRLLNPQEKRRCTLSCQDGDLDMPAYILGFEESS